VTARADVLDGRPVVVSEFLFPPVDESEPAQRVSLTFDADGLPVNEVRRPDGGDSGWTKKTITYNVDFVDPATLPENFWQGRDVGGPAPETGPPATELPPGEGSYFFETAEAAAPKVAELAQQGLPVTWLGPEHAGSRFSALSVDYSFSPAGTAPVVAILYTGLGAEMMMLNETTAANWPAIQGVYPDIASIETTGQPVEGVGERAFLARGDAFQTPTFGWLVLFDNGAVVMIELESSAATIAETDALLIAAAKALEPFPGS